MSNDSIQQETWVPHEELSKAVEEWAQEAELEQLPPEAQKIMRAVFTEGWSACLHSTMSPARDLAMALLQMIQIARTRFAENPRLMLGGQSLEFIEEMCHKLVGQPADWQLESLVEAIEVTDENEADLPEEVREALRKAREAAKEDKKEN